MSNIKELGEVVTFACAFASAVDKASQDGVINLMDVKEFLPLISKGMAAMNGLADVVQELKDLDQSELDTLVATAKAQLNLSNKELENKIENTFGYLQDFYSAFEFLKSFLSAKPAA